MLVHRQFRIDVHAKVTDDRYWLDHAPADVYCPITLGHFAKMCDSTKPQHFRFAVVELETLRRTPPADVVNARL